MKYALRQLKRALKISALNLTWKNRNQHNHTSVGLLCNLDCIKVGKETYGIINANNFDHEPSETVGLEIGNYCSIADDVYFLLAGEHELGYASTFPYERFRPESRVYAANFSKGKIIIDDDVWIGYGSTILSGVHIGQGAVIGAKSVINKDVPPYAIVGGVPAKILKYRFKPEIIEVMIHLDYSKVTYKTIESHPEIFKEELNDIDPFFLEDSLKTAGVYNAR